MDNKAHNPLLEQGVHDIRYDSITRATEIASRAEESYGQLLSKDSVRILKMVLHGILETAVEDGIVPTNVAHTKPKRGANAASRRAKGER